MDTLKIKLLEQWRLARECEDDYLVDIVVDASHLEDAGQLVLDLDQELDNAKNT